MDENIRNRLVEKCKAISDNPEDNDLIVGYLHEIQELIELLWY